MGAGVVLVLAGGATSAYADANATNNSQSGGVAIAISRGDDNSINQSNTSSQSATCNQNTTAIGGGGERSSSDSSSPGVGGSVSSSCHISQSVRQSNSIGGLRGHPHKVHAVKGTRTTVVSTQLAFTGRETPVLTAMGLLLAVLGAWLVVVSKRQPATAATA